MDHNHYILAGPDGRTVKVVDLLEWARWLEVERTARTVGKTNIGPFLVSTVFLGLDHNFGEGPPVLWESMIFTDGLRSKLNYHADRCAGTWEQAEAMHDKMCEFVRQHIRKHPTLKTKTYDHEKYRASIDRLRKRAKTRFARINAKAKSPIKDTTEGKAPDAPAEGT